MSSRIYTPPVTITYPNMGESLAAGTVDAIRTNSISYHQVGHSVMRLNGTVSGQSITPIIGDARIAALATVPNTPSQSMTLPIQFPAGVDSYCLIMRYKMAKTGSQVQTMTVKLIKQANVGPAQVTQTIYTSPASYNIVQDVYTTGLLSSGALNDIRPLSDHVEYGQCTITVTKAGASPASSTRPARYWDGLMSFHLILFRA